MTIKDDEMVYHCAQTLIELHGEEALKQSRSNINHSIAANDNQAVSVWCKIEDAINDLNDLARGDKTIN
jgi:hypothetical protein